MGDEDRPAMSDVFVILSTARQKLLELESLSAGELEAAERERLSRILEDLIVEAKRVMEAFGTRCRFCRTAPADIVGVCAKCDGQACTNCATVFQGVILHRGTCAAFYDGGEQHT